jgi:hypothetical protein
MIQAAKVSTYEFGAPVAEAVVIRFKVREAQGGIVNFNFQNPGDNDGIVTVQDSADGTTWYDTALADLTIKSGGYKSTDVQIKQNTRRHLRVQASGGTRMQLQIRPNELLDIVVV